MNLVSCPKLGCLPELHGWYCLLALDALSFPQAGGLGWFLGLPSVVFTLHASWASLQDDRDEWDHCK